MYIGGMQTTPDATYAPRRTDDPPGTTRTLSLVVNRRIGYVCLSTNARLPPSKVVSLPTRKPSRIPRFTHGTARHVPSDPRSAARTAPASRASSNSLTTDSASPGRVLPDGVE